MSVLTGCEDARNMKKIEEITCPGCHKEGGIEVILKEGCTVGDSVCDACGYVIPEGTNLEEYLHESENK
ncbi:MAG: hypothetical protein ACOX8E_03015 [Ruminococcus sp.]|jgi:transcription elongation factor Elf1